MDLRCPCGLPIKNEYLFGVYVQTAATATATATASAGEDALLTRFVYACPRLAQGRGKRGYSYIVLIDESGKAIGDANAEAAYFPFDTGEAEETEEATMELGVNKKAKRKRRRKRQQKMENAEVPVKTKARAKAKAKKGEKKEVVDYAALSVLVASIKGKLSQAYARVEGE